MNQKTVIIESHIPYIKGCLEDAGCRVRYLAPQEITAASVRDADALIVRTRTRCDATLLEGSRVKIVATATIGTDHIDMPWCHDAGITVANAPGCNAAAVAQYVMASIATLAFRPVSQYTLGIIGVGHVGSIVERWARALDMNVLICDPPRQRRGDDGNWCTAAHIARHADIVTLHTPLTADGDDATYHLVNDSFINSLRRAPVIINAARGAVVDTPALIKGLQNGRVKDAVIDCWEGEPAIDPTLCALSAIATPHIAGYSREGKIRATAMALRAVAHTLKLPVTPLPAVPLPPEPPQTVSIPGLLSTFDPAPLTASLKAIFTSDARPAAEQTQSQAPSPGKAFETLRNAYTLRREPPFSPID